MKRNNFRILWYIIAVALFLVAIAGLNLKLQGDHAKENKTTQSATVIIVKIGQLLVEVLLKMD